jgi:SEC-C motif-containing protein
MISNDEACPCDSGNDYQACCFPLHQGEKGADTAEQLMRSRYCAYVVGDVDYVEKTQVPDPNDPFDKESAKAWSESSDWLGLTIDDVVAGGPEDQKGEVDFTASYIDAEGREHHHKEHSYFVKKNGQWLFDHGDILTNEPYRREEPKVGRNDPCPCGSGKKFKKCCGK